MTDSLRDADTCAPRKLVRLFRFSWPVNLIERSDVVGLGAALNHTLSKETLATKFHMKGPFPYIGGKCKIAKKIIETFPNHKTYVEVFGGGAQVLFHKEPSTVEVLNDLDGDVFTFFRVCQLHHDELVRFLRFTVTSRQWFDLFLAQDPGLLTDIERATRFFYLQKNAYAGLVRSRDFGYSVQEPSRFNPESVPQLIEDTHKRLARVQVERLPYQELVKKYDRPTTLFYLDPPYFGRKLYNLNFAEKDFVELSKRLRVLQGKFVLSLNDVTEVRQIFSPFQFREIELAYTAQPTAGKRFRELLISNFHIVPLRSEPKQ